MHDAHSMWEMRECTGEKKKKKKKIFSLVLSPSSEFLLLLLLSRCTSSPIHIAIAWDRNIHMTRCVYNIACINACVCTCELVCVLNCQAKIDRNLLMCMLNASAHCAQHSTQCNAMRLDAGWFWFSVLKRRHKQSCALFTNADYYYYYSHFERIDKKIWHRTPE